MADQQTNEEHIFTHDIQSDDQQELNTKDSFPEEQHQHINEGNCDHQQLIIDDTNFTNDQPDEENDDQQTDEEQHNDHQDEEHNDQHKEEDEEDLTESDDNSPNPAENPLQKDDEKTIENSPSELIDDLQIEVKSDEDQIDLSLNPAENHNENDDNSQSIEQQQQQQQQHSNKINEENPSIDDTFHLMNPNHLNKPEQFKSQRDLDEEPIPSGESFVESAPSIVPLHSLNIDEHREEMSDTRPLTQLETPFELHQIQNNDEEKENVVPIDEDLSIHEEKSNEIDVGREEIHLEKPSMEEIDEKRAEDDHVKHFNEEILPPLPTDSIANDFTFQDHLLQDIPSTTNGQQSTSTRLKEEQKQEEEEEEEEEDILSNGTLLKRSEKKGISNARPTRSTLVRISYSLSLKDEKTCEIELIEEVKDHQLFVGENDVIPAIDICVQSMNEGEIALISSDVRHCYGTNGCQEKNVRPHTDLNPYRILIRLELHQWIPSPNVQLLSAQERIFWADQKKQMGNFHYRREEYSVSLQCYRGALRFLDLENNPLKDETTEEDRLKLIDQYIQVQNNVAQVNLILKRYEYCLNAVENVLKYESKNVKALFRQGKALFQLGKFDEVILPLKRILQIQSNHPDKEQIMQMIQSAEHKVALYQQNEKEIYRRMFQSSTTANNNSLTSRPSTIKTQTSTNHLWNYVAIGSALVALIGIVTFVKFRQS